MKIQKKILLGIGVTFVALMFLILVLPGSESATDTPAGPAATTEALEPVAVSSLAGCRVVDSIRCEVYRKLFLQISTVYFPDLSAEFTDADFDWVDCVAFVASEHLFLDSNQTLVEGAVQDGINLCGPIS